MEEKIELLNNLIIHSILFVLFQKRYFFFNNVLFFSFSRYFEDKVFLALNHGQLAVFKRDKSKKKEVSKKFFSNKINLFRSTMGF